MIYTDIKFPTQIRYFDFSFPLVKNDSMVWKGQIAVVVDAENNVFQDHSLVFDPAWWHCAGCQKRLSFGDVFCSSCGIRLDWAHTTRDPEAEAAWQAQVNAEIDGLQKHTAPLDEDLGIEAG